MGKRTFAVQLLETGRGFSTFKIPFSAFLDQDGLHPDISRLRSMKMVLLPQRRDSREHVLVIRKLSLLREGIAMKPGKRTFAVKGAIVDDHNTPIQAQAITLLDSHGIYPLKNLSVTFSEGGEFFLVHSVAQLPYRAEPERLEHIPGSIDCYLWIAMDGFQTVCKGIKLKEGETNMGKLTLHRTTMSSTLRQVGPDLYDGEGNKVWLQGVCIDSLEWSATGDHILESTMVALSDWHANVIRLPVKETFWFGREKWQHDGGKGYRQLIDRVVRLTSERGAYLVLDLHRFGAPGEEHVRFWKDAAAHFANHPAVIFELFNEPHGISWELWRDGGDLSDPRHRHKDENAAENNEQSKIRYCVGMQALVNAVRSTGAKNVVIVGGLDWSYDLRGVMNGYALNDDSGNGIVYSSHVYPWKSDWNRFLVAAKKYPLFIGEVGCQPTPMPWQKHGTEDPETWAPDMLGLIQKYRLHWTGFSFHPKCGPPMLKDWTYEPTPYWGRFVKEALSGKIFELKRLR
ncbi:MAG: hypothetical protein D6820_09155 [Lentisphaerae bacterium]|nr:MAG: hypothetical protein D6820_09155 [Lentisphaerota bacterium]